MLTDKELNEIEARLAKSLPEWESRFVMLGGPSTAFVVQLLANAVTLLAEVRRLRPVLGPRGDEDE